MNIKKYKITEQIKYERVLPKLKSIFGMAMLLVFFNGCQVKQSSKIYVPYDTFTKSRDFQIRINGEEIFVAKEACFGNRTFNTAQFQVAGRTAIVIEASEPIEDYEIRPYHLNIKGKIKGNTLSFSVTEPTMLFVTINKYEPLCLFQTPPEKNVPDPSDPNVHYFSKGVHDVGLISPKSGQTIYLEQGALVKGRIYAEDVSDVSIRGRGILDARGHTSKPEKKCGIEFKNGKNIKIEGIGLRTGEWWQVLFLLCKDVEVKNMNLMSFGLNNDGIDIDGVENFRASNCFIGCGDDGFGWHAVDAENNGEPPTKNCVAEHCVIYNTHAGNGLRVGASMETQLFQDITFRDITVLAHANAGIYSDYSDWALCKDLTFENFHIEQADRPIEIKIEKTRYSNSTGFRDERGHINGLYFKNVVAAGGKIILEGYDEEHLIENVRFINCKVAGKKITDTTQIITNEFVRNIVFE